MIRVWLEPRRRARRMQSATDPCPHSLVEEREILSLKAGVQFSVGVPFQRGLTVSHFSVKEAII